MRLVIIALVVLVVASIEAALNTNHYIIIGSSLIVGAVLLIGWRAKRMDHLPKH